jgi:hypothetical protein
VGETGVVVDQFGQKGILRLGGCATDSKILFKLKDFSQFFKQLSHVVSRIPISRYTGGVALLPLFKPVIGTLFPVFPFDARALTLMILMSMAIGY